MLRNVTDPVVRAVVLEDAKDKRNKLLGRAGGTRAEIRGCSLCIRSLQSLRGTSQWSLEQGEEVVQSLRAWSLPAEKQRKQWWRENGAEGN